MNMKVLVYGTYGLLGKMFLKLSHNLKADIVIGKADITDILSVEYDLKCNPDIIINFAGIKDCGYKFYPKLFDTNIIGVLNLLHVSDLNIPIICMGSIAALTPEYSMYAMSKKHLEDIAIFHKRLKIIRIPGVFSFNRKIGVVYKFLMKCLQGENIKINSDLKYWNCILDETLMFTLIERLGTIINYQYQYFNIGYFNTYTLSDIAKFIKDKLNSKSNIEIGKEPKPFSMHSIDGVYLRPYVKLDYDLTKYINFLR